MKIISFTAAYTLSFMIELTNLYIRKAITVCLVVILKTSSGVCLHNVAVYYTSLSMLSMVITCFDTALPMVSTTCPVCLPVQAMVGPSDGLRPILLRNGPHVTSVSYTWVCCSMGCKDEFVALLRTGGRVLVSWPPGDRRWS